MSSTVSQGALEAAMKAAVACGMIPRHADEAAYLRNWEGMKAVLAAAQAAEQVFGMKVVINETLPPNTIELRGENTVRMTSIPKWEDAILPPGGNGGPPIEWSETELAMMEEINLLRAALTSR